MNVIATVNQKGGVGKSTTALSMGAGLRRRGYTVLLIDMDAQCNLTHTMQADTTKLTTLDILTQQASAADAIQHTPVGDIIPSTSALAGADAAITQDKKEYCLRDALEPIKGTYDYVILDTPPALGILTINALTAATSAVIPAQADMYSLQGITDLSGTVDAVKRYCNPALTITGVLLTRYSRRAILGRELAEAIEQAAESFGTSLFKATIREAIAIKEAQAVRQDIFTYAPKSKVAADYDQFVGELLERS